MGPTLRRLRGEPLERGLEEAFALALADSNARRLRVLASLMACVHAAHVALFWTSADARRTLAPTVVQWRDSLVIAHGVMVPLALAMVAIAFRARRPWILKLLAPCAATLYLVHGAICASLDQMVVTNVGAWVGYSIGVAVVVSIPPLASLVAYVVGATTLTIGMLLLQHSAAARLSSLPNCATTALIGLIVSWLVYAARRREFAQRRTIDRQQEELSQLNAGLERRVREQVQEIVARAGEVDRLNAQLQAQVRARSSELSMALARLAKHLGADHALKPGAVLAERFVIEQVIGQGGMGSVYAGLDRTSGERVAIKVIQATSSKQLDAIRRFIREAGTTATIAHPAVVRMLHVDVSDDGLLFQVQELVEGETLTQRLRGPWAPTDAARLGSGLCDALAAAHAHGVVHRDVKPDNVMLTARAPGLKLLDFGIAKLYDAVSRSDDATLAGMILGTPAYMAPEQVSGGSEVTDRADVYSVGIILFRLLTARLPFDAGSPKEMMMRHVLVAPPDVRSYLPSAPEPLALAIARCLAKDPAARPSSAQLAAELRAWADAEGARPLESVDAPRPAPESTVPTPRRRVLPS